MSDVPPAPPIMVGGYGSGGGYKFSEDEIDGVIKKWENLLQDLNQDLVHATKIAEVTAPANEFASHDFIDKGANPSGQTLLKQHTRMRDYVQNFIEALKAAKNKITLDQQLQRDNLDKTGV